MIALEPGFLRGSYPPLVTPFRDGRVNYDAFSKLVELQIEAASHGIVVAGTTAEPSTLTVDERARLLDVAVETVRGRIPIVAAIGGQSHAETVELCARADRSGPDPLLVVTPYYVRPPQRGLVEYYADLGARTRKPILIYHIPVRAAVTLEFETLVQIVKRVPTLVGMKHAANDLDLVSHALESLGREFRIHVGLEPLSFPMLCIGASGMMNAVGNIAPRHVARLYEAVAGGHLDAARALHFELLELNRAIFFDTNPIPLEYMMTRMGLLERNEHRLPMVPATAELEKRLDGVLERAKLV